ncbi:ABC transporter permease [Bacteroidia bacterium]|nr:ABC transporter permease [Bacteroidia bacterium]
MNLELFIAQRLLRKGGPHEKAVSVPIVRIALLGIALGVCVILLSVFIVGGFKKEITQKVTGFSSHLNIVSYGNNNYYGDEKVKYSDTLATALTNIQETKNVYGFINKPSILKSGTEINGVVLYGVDTAYNTVFLQENLKQGELPDYHTERASDEILLSASVAKILSLGVGDKVQAHFVQEPPRARVFTVKGIYDTGFKEYDEIIVFCDLRHLQRLNSWASDEVSGIAVELHDIELLPQAVEAVETALSLVEEDDYFYKVKTIYEMSPQMFDWLNLINTNIWVILILVITVAGFNMVSGLFILILDKTLLIGVLKALGYQNIKLRKLFLYVSMKLIGKGILWGNGLAFLIGFIQYKFKLIHLDPSSYYMDTVPLEFNFLYVILLDLCVWVVSTLVLVLPTMLISKINPIKAIRFE